MKKVNIRIIIDGNSRDIDFCRLEKTDIKPLGNFFSFQNDQWIGLFNDFQVDTFLDILIIVRGNPQIQSRMMVFINDVSNGPYSLFEPFNRNGYGQFNEEVPV
jgi:hypothetical protein